MNRSKLLMILSAAALLVALQAVVILTVKTYRVPTGAMSPAITPGEHVLMLRARDAGRGDIAVFRWPPDRRYDFVMRVVAVGGETVEIRNKQLFIDGRAAIEPHAVRSDIAIYPKNGSMPEPYRSRDQFGPLRVPPGHFFVLGDNRDASHDSRWWGTVPRELVRGRVILVYSSGRIRRPAAPRTAPAPAPR